MTTTITAYNNAEKVRFKCTYRNGSLFKAEIIAGKLLRGSWVGLCVWVPAQLKDVEEHKKKFPYCDYILHDEPKYDSTYKEYVSAWFSFFKSLNGINPKFTATDGVALKSIIRYLEAEAYTPHEAFSTWVALLARWRELDDFYRKSPDLKFINSQMNKIITNLNDVSKKENNRDAADLRSSY